MWRGFPVQTRPSRWLGLDFLLTLFCRYCPVVSYSMERLRALAFFRSLCLACNVRTLVVPRCITPLLWCCYLWHFQMKTSNGTELHGESVHTCVCSCMGGPCACPGLHRTIALLLLK